MRRRKDQGGHQYDDKGCEDTFHWMAPLITSTSRRLKSVTLTITSEAPRSP
jgi:hypothetical protein